jgi:hypothetical protein
VRGNEEQHTRAEKYGAKYDGYEHLPSAAAGLGIRRFICADGRGGHIIDKACALPTCQPAIRVLHAVE